MNKFNAETAHEIANAYHVQNMMETIMNQIEHAAEHGQFHLEYILTPDDEHIVSVIRELYELGFDIIPYDDRLIIFW